MLTGTGRSGEQADRSLPRVGVHLSPRPPPPQGDAACLGGGQTPPPGVVLLVVLHASRKRLRHFHRFRGVIRLLPAYM